VFDDCEGLEDCKTHAKRFCLQDSNPFIHEKRIYLSMSFLGFVSKINVLERERCLLQWFYLT
jgi:hypothetical protein